MILSKRAETLKDSPLQDFFIKTKELRTKGEDIISLGVGEPYNSTPLAIKMSGIMAIIKNITGYLPAIGSPEIRRVLADKYQADVNEVIVSHGAKTVFGAMIELLIDPGDKVIIPAPYYPPFVEKVIYDGGIPILVDTAKTNFQISASEIEKAITKNTPKPKVLIINSPNNPSGISYSENELSEIAELCQKHNIAIISDECYQHFSDNPDFTFREIDNSAIIIGSCSKTYAMPGWRIGWGIMPTELATAMKRHSGNAIGSPDSISVQAAITALKGNGIKDFEHQRQMVYEWFWNNNIPFEKSTGGFYAFPNFSRYTQKIGGSVKLAEHLLKFGIAVTPGVAFGKDYDDYLRLSFCVAPKTLSKALKRLKRGLEAI